jgi:hypothetical protein
MLLNRKPMSWHTRAVRRGRFQQLGSFVKRNIAVASQAEAWIAGDLAIG